MKGFLKAHLNCIFFEEEYGESSGIFSTMGRRNFVICVIGVGFRRVPSVMPEMRFYRSSHAKERANSGLRVIRTLFAGSQQSVCYLWQIRARSTSEITRCQDHVNMTVAISP